MKFRIVIALLFYIIGLSKLVDWFIFLGNNKKELEQLEHAQVMERFNARFPDYFTPIFSGYPEPATVISIILFVFSGIIFLKEKKMIYKILAYSSFLFAFWNLFSIL